MPSSLPSTSGRAAPRTAEPLSRSRRDPSSAPLARLVASDEGTLRAWSLLVTCSAVIFFLNTRPDLRVTARNDLQYYLAQSGHFLTHVALGALAWDAFTRTCGHRRGYWLAFAAASLHAVLDEWVQVYVPSRNANLEDVLTNLAGVACGIGVMEYVRWRTNRATLRRYRRAARQEPERPPRRGARAVVRGRRPD